MFFFRLLYVWLPRSISSIMCLGMRWNVRHFSNVRWWYLLRWRETWTLMWINLGHGWIGLREKHEVGDYFRVSTIPPLSSRALEASQILTIFFIFISGRHRYNLHHRSRHVTHHQGSCCHHSCISFAVNIADEHVNLDDSSLPRQQTVLTLRSAFEILSEIV